MFVERISSKLEVRNSFSLFNGTFYDRLMHELKGVVNFKATPSTYDGKL